MSGTELLGCGVADHDDTCLCDVNIPPRSGAMVPMSDNWVLQLVADHFDLSWPWTPDKFGFLLEKADMFINEYHEKGRHLTAATSHISVRIMEGERGVRESFPEYVKRAKQTIAETALALGDKCLPSQVAAACSIGHDEFVKLLTMNRVDPALVPPDLYDNIVTQLRDGKPFKRVCLDHGVDPNTRSGTAAWLRRTFIQQFDNKQETT
jgi:hypothetical protein